MMLARRRPLVLAILVLISALVLTPAAAAPADPWSMNGPGIDGAITDGTILVWTTSRSVPVNGRETTTSRLQAAWVRDGRPIPVTLERANMAVSGVERGFIVWTELPADNPAGQGDIWALELATNRLIPIAVTEEDEGGAQIVYPWVIWRHSTALATVLLRRDLTTLGPPDQRADHRWSLCALDGDDGTAPE